MDFAISAAFGDLDEAVGGREARGIIIDFVGERLLVVIGIVYNIIDVVAVVAVIAVVVAGIHSNVHLCNMVLALVVV